VARRKTRARRHTSRDTRRRHAAVNNQKKWAMTPEDGGRAGYKTEGLGRRGFRRPRVGCTPCRRDGAVPRAPRGKHWATFRGEKSSRAGYLMELNGCGVKTFKSSPPPRAIGLASGGRHPPISCATDRSRTPPYSGFGNHVPSSAPLGMTTYESSTQLNVSGVFFSSLFVECRD
jgi:hypothetical protein